VETYSEQVGQFLAFVEAHYPRLHSIQGVNHDVLADYLAFLARAPASPRGRQRARVTSADVE